MKELYAQDFDFHKAYEACKSLVQHDRGKWIEFIIQDGLLFRNNQLCIPKCSMRENLSEKNIVEDYLVILVMTKPLSSYNIFITDLR